MVEGSKMTDQRPPETHTRKIKSFEDIDAWRESAALATRVIQIFTPIQMDPGFRNEIQKAATDISAAIAKGKERESVSDFVRFLQEARDSTAKLRTLLHIAGKTGYITSSVFFELSQKTEEIGKMIGALAKSMKKWE